MKLAGNKRGRKLLQEYAPSLASMGRDEIKAKSLSRLARPDNLEAGGEHDRSLRPVETPNFLSYRHRCGSRLHCALKSGVQRAVPPGAKLFPSYRISEFLEAEQTAAVQSEVFSVATRLHHTTRSNRTPKHTLRQRQLSRYLPGLTIAPRSLRPRQKTPTQRSLPLNSSPGGGGGNQARW